MPGSQVHDACPNCLGVQFVDDYVSGETICISCGTVLPDRLSMVAQPSAPECCPEFIDIDEEFDQMPSNPFERATQSDKSRGQRCSLLPSVITLAQTISRELFTIERRKNSPATPVSLYVACKMLGTPRSMKDMCALTQTPVKSAWSLYNKASKVERFSKMFMNQRQDTPEQDFYPNTTAGVAARILDSLTAHKRVELDPRDHEKVRRKCEALMFQLYRYHPKASPETLAAVALFAVLSRCQSRLHVRTENQSPNDSVTLDMEDIAQAAQVPEDVIHTTWDSSPDCIKMPSPLPRQILR